MKKDLVRVNKKLMEKFQNEYYNSIWYWPTFSCNEFGNFWVCDSRGPTKVKNPVDVDEFPFIEDIVNMALLKRPEGGRFHVKDDHAVYAIRTRICEIELY